MDIEKKLYSIILEALNVECLQIEMKQDVVLMDIGFDSLKLVEMILRIEEEFEIVFEDEDFDLEKIGTYGGMLEIIKAKRLG